MRILYLAFKDMYQIFLQKKSALFLLVLPLLFTWLMGMIFNQNSGEDPRLPVGFVNQDLGVLSTSLQTLLDASGTIRPVMLEAQGMHNLQEQVRSQKVAAVIIVPDGFSEETLAGKSPQLIVLVNRDIAVGRTANRSIQLAATRLLGAVHAAFLSTEAHGDFSDETQKQDFLLSSLTLAVQSWQQPRLKVSSEQAGRAPGGVPRDAYDGFIQASSGMIVFFATSGMVTAGYVLLTERRSHTLARMLITSLTRTEVIAGHTLAMFLVSFLQILLLTVFGQWVLGVNYWHAPCAILVMTGSLALFSASFGLLISALSRSENQVVLLALGSTLVLALMGGAFFPLELTGKSFAATGHLMPSAWAIDGLQSISLRGLGLQAALLPAGILLAYASVVFCLALWRFRFETG